MNDNDKSSQLRPPRPPVWNQGKLIGAKPPLGPSHVWSFRTKPPIEQRTRDLALFNLAIDNKLRGCDVVAYGAGPSALQTDPERRRWPI